VLVTADEKLLWNRLPEAQRWRALHARAAPLALKFRSTTLTNARQSLALLGYVKSNASSFERLSFAGRLVRELAARRPKRIGLIVSPALEDCAQWCEALLSAVWSESFALPDFRTRAGDAWALQEIELYAAPPLDIERIAASARAGNLVRALTALPPNVLDARAYRRLLTGLARRHGLGLQWYSEARLRGLGAGAFLAVARVATPHVTPASRSCAGVVRVLVGAHARGRRMWHSWARASCSTPAA
jgi:leucyl aminopeptidase